MTEEDQRCILDDARELGWPGTIPGTLGTFTAERAVTQAQAYLDAHAEQYEELKSQRAGELLDRFNETTPWVKLKRQREKQQLLDHWAREREKYQSQHKERE